MSDKDSRRSISDFEADTPGTAERSAAEARIEDLRQQGGIFVEAVRVTRMPMVVTDPSLPNNPIVFANEAFLTLSGYHMEEVLGQQPFFMNGPETDSADAASFRQAIGEDRDEVIETVQYRKDGSRFVAAVLLRAVKGPGGETVNQFLSFLDVTIAQRNREILESISDAFYAVDSHWRFTYVNHQAERWWGRNREGLIGQVFWEEFPGARDSAIGKAHMRAASTGQVVRLEAEMAAPTQGIDATIFPTADGGLSVYFRDITEKKHSEILVKDSEERLATIFANASVGLSEISFAGRYLEANAEFCRIVGRSREELLGLSTADVIAEDDMPATLAAVGKIQDGGQSAELEKRYRQPGGQVVWANSYVSRLRHPDGNPDTLLVVTTDITARRENERALRDSEERHRLILETALDYAIFTTDAEGLIQTWSPGAEATFGWSAEEIRGHHFSDTFVPEDRAADIPRRELAEAAEKGVAPNIRWHTRKNGKRVFIDGWTRPLRSEDGSLQGFLKVGQDTTERHQWEETQKVLVAELQHRTRNLIGVVRSIANQTMAQTGPTEAFRSEFDDRLTALSRVQGLLSRAGEERVVIGDLIKMELDALGADALGDRVTIEGPAVPLRNSVVQTLSLALHELATNARKYGALAVPGGRLRVSWTTRHKEDEGRRLSLEWLEEGIRIRPSEAAAPRQGYGRELIEKALPYSLGAKTSFELKGGRLHCLIDLPLNRKRR